MSTTSALEAVVHLRTRRRRRAAAVLTVALVATVVLAVVSLMLGAANISPARALAAVVGAGDRGDVFVVQRLRLPRVLAGLLAGAGFALAGALFQTTLRNPLASPDILGISHGASLGAVWAILGLGLHGYVVAGFALGGALTAALAIWVLAWRRGLHSIRFVLVGVGISYVCGSLLAWLLARAEVRDAQTALLWTIGSVADVRGTSLTLLAAGVLGLGVCVAFVARRQSALTLGDDYASSLGVRVHATRVTTLVLAVGLVAISTAATGPIAFVALVAPPIARRLLDDGGADLVASAAIGALLVLAADLLGQHGPLTAPVGVITGLVGAPYLLWLLSGRSSSGKKVRA